MAAISDYLEDHIINYFLRNNAATFTPAATLYVALFTADPTDTGSTANEVTQATNSYARKAITFAAPTAGSTSNTVSIEFTDMPAATVTHFGVFDSATYQAGNMYYHGALTASVTTNAGDTVTIDASALTITND